MKGTLKQTVNKFIFLFVVPLNILLIITNSFFMFSTYRQTKISTENMVNYFLDDIDSRLSTISFFLIKNGTEDPAFQSIAFDYAGKDYALEKFTYTKILIQKLIFARKLPIYSCFILKTTKWSSSLLQNMCRMVVIRQKRLFAKC